MLKYPVYKPSLSGNEKKYVNECLDSTWISSKGKFVIEFENKFAEYINIKYATSVCNGTVALHLALVTLGIGKHDEVIVPTFTYIASVNSIVYTGAKPIFVDSLKDSWQMDPDDIEKKITDKTKAIMVVHLYGHPCDMNKIMKIANKYNLLVIEDCAEAFGSLYESKHVGTFGDIATFSFFGNKTITTGEGGMVVTNDPFLYEKMTHLKSQGVSRNKEYYHDVIGYNYRMTNICAAIGLAQLEQADKFIQKKREIAKWYSDFLNNSKVTIHKEIGNVRHSYWMVSILVDKKENRDPLRKYLLENGIETRPLFYPAHIMPVYSQKYQKHPVAIDIGLRGINLPSYPDLTIDDVELISRKILSYYQK